MSEKQRNIIIVLVAVILVGVLLGIFLRDNGAPASPTGTIGVPNSQSGASGHDNISSFSANVPKDAVVTKPDVSAPASQNTGAILGIYKMQVSVAGFNPKTIVMKKGDLLRIDLTAIDGNYDFVMPYAGLQASVKKGETKPISWGATTEGTFNFACRDFCPPGKTIQGELIVKP